MNHAIPTTEMDRAKPLPGLRCQEASPASHSTYIACGRPAEFIVTNRGETYAMCEMCADHNVKNRGARYVHAQESYHLTSITTIVDDELPPEPGDNQLKRVSNLARLQMQLEDEVEAIQESLKQAIARLDRVAEVDLPEAMASVDLEKFTMPGGFEINTAAKIGAHPLVENKPFICSWLDDHGHEAIVKHDVTVTFGMKQSAEAAGFVEWIRQSFPNNRLNDNEYVHPGTLSAFVRERMEKGEILPDEFGVDVTHRAKIKRPKKSEDVI